MIKQLTICAMQKCLILLSLFILASCGQEINRDPEVANKHAPPDSVFLAARESELIFFVLSDWGRNGYYYQKEVAGAMGLFADTWEGPEFIVSCGDNFQVNGIASTSDPLWQSNFETVYNHPALLVDWYPVLGNHDYKGSVEAQIRYSEISRRWKMHDHYYTVVKTINDSSRLRLIFIDTPALLADYRKNKEEYPDACLQDSAAQMHWLSQTLSQSTEDWIIVVGHHPVYSASPKHGNTPELLASLEPLFESAGVDLYLCGHDHDMQHLRPDSATTDYVVCGTGATVRESGHNADTKANFSEPGFSIVSIRNDTLLLSFVKADGTRLYTLKRIAR